MVISHLLVIRLSSMGDIVLQTALLSALRRDYGESIRITFVCSKEFTSLLVGHPDVDRVISFDRRDKEASLIQSIKKLHKEYPIGMIVDLHGSTRSFMVRMALWNVPSIVVDKRRWERFLFTKMKINLFGQKPLAQVERILKDFSFLFQAPVKREALHQYVCSRSPVVERDGDQRMTSLTPFIDLPATFSFAPKKYVVLVPSASFANKRWPILSFVALAAKILADGKKKLVVLAGPQDHFCQAFHYLEEQYPERFLNLQGKTSLKESLAVAAGASLVIGNDTGIPHVAEAYGVPVLTFFGPTSESFGFIPHLKSSLSLSKKLWCRPCSPTGKKGCFRKENLCLTSLSLEEVWQKLISWDVWRGLNVVD